MDEVFHKIREIVDKLIFPALLLLLLIIIGEFFFHELLQPYQLWVDVLDYSIISLFIIDLFFKAHHSHSVQGFLRRYWLEILAVFPLYLVFRFFEGFATAFGLVAETTKETQQIVHVSTELSREGKEIGGLAKEVGKAEKSFQAIVRSDRLAKFSEFLRPLLRLPRFLKLTPREYEKDTKEYIKFFDDDGIKKSKKISSVKKRVMKKKRRK